jgi:glycosyltransferase involved in cell wall biosynthesis
MPFFRLCDLVVFPSLDRETFGNVILEAWAYDKPLVTTAFRGAREIVTPNETGVVAPCEDPSALAQAIELTLRDEVLRGDLVSAGRRELQRMFSKSAVMAQYIALYQKLTG